jgi:hypothetical protein
MVSGLDPVQYWSASARRLVTVPSSRWATLLAEEHTISPLVDPDTALYRRLGTIERDIAPLLGGGRVISPGD